MCCCSWVYFPNRSAQNREAANFRNGKDWFGVVTVVKIQPVWESHDTWVLGKNLKECLSYPFKLSSCLCKLGGSGAAYAPSLLFETVSLLRHLAEAIRTLFLFTLPSTKKHPDSSGKKQLVQLNSSERDTCRITRLMKDIIHHT